MTLLVIPLLLGTPVQAATPCDGAEGAGADLAEILEGVALQEARNHADTLAGPRPHDESEGSWLRFIGTASSNLTFDGMIDRYQEVERVIEQVEAGASPHGIGIPTKDYRLRNVAEMTDVIESLPPGVESPAAFSLRDANAWFYVTFGNKGGDFSEMDMAEYRNIGAMPGDQAAEVLPEFEAKLFAASADPATVSFGNSLPAEQRLQLFLVHNRLVAPDTR